jgi:hypothetical protein
MVKYLDNYAAAIFGMTQQQARRQGICIRCKARPPEDMDAYAQREYSISALCPECFDQICEEKTDGL